MPTDLAVWVTSWNRPAFLKQTLDSLFNQADIPLDVFLVDNGSSPETQELIKADRRLARYWLLPENRGINWPIQNLLPTVLDHAFVMPCDHDAYHARPLSLYLSVLKARPDIGIATGHFGPEHPSEGHFDYEGERWLIKPHERGGCMVLSAELLRSFFPLPETLIHFDSHCMTCLAKIGRKVAVLPGAVIHLGWRKGESCWQDIEIPEAYILEDGKIIARP